MSNLKAITAKLQEVVNSGVYDQTKTTIRGMTRSATIDGLTILGPPLVKWCDIYNDSSLDTALYFNLTSNGRLFSITTPFGGLCRINLHNFNLLTGETTYVGKVVINLPNTAATTHTIRGFKVDDSVSSNIRVFIASAATTLINGGLFVVHKLDITDFIPIGFPTIGFATGTDVKGVYFLQDPANMGASNLNVSPSGLTVDFSTKKCYVHNGVSATHQFYIYDYNSSPIYSKSSVTITNASPAVSTQTAHGYGVNDPITFDTLGALPAPLVAGTVYFIKNPTANTFEVSTTTVGASINTTTSGSGLHTMGRAFATSENNFSFKTGNLPSLTGTLLLLNCEDYAVPNHTTNATFPCVFFATSTNLYLGKLSDLTNGAVTWASLVTSNLLGTTNQIVAPQAAIATWSSSLDSAIYSTNTTKFVIKKIINNEISDIVGCLNTEFLETQPGSTATQFGLVTVSNVKASGDWLTILGSSLGQRGTISMPIGASFKVDSTYIISKVLDTPKTLKYIGVSTPQQLTDITTSSRVSYRVSGFNTENTGWVLLSSNKLMSGITPGTQIQFKINFIQLSSLVSNSAQVIDLFLQYEDLNNISTNWGGSVDNTSPNGSSPAYTAFRLLTQYSTSVPALYFRAYDDSDVLVASANTVSNPTFFEYSTNNGTSWNALGVIPNSALTTEVRYKWSSPPGVRVTVSIRES